MFDDDDIKIAEPGKIRRSAKIMKADRSASVSEEYEKENAKGNTDKAKKLGKELAGKVVAELDTFTTDEESGNAEMVTERGLLMAFAAVAAVETGIKSSVVAQAAKNSLSTELEKLSPMLYKAMNDSGAFSFYYLAYRRGTEVDRRMGQTFAMLCSHDGDPVYQELGEAIYCWFTSVSVKAIKTSGIA